jgi:sugar lactone lactonase YvrE
VLGASHPASTRAKATHPGSIALVTHDRSVRRVAYAIAFPNEMTVTPDNSTLMIAESLAGRPTAFDIAADGSLSNRRVRRTTPAPIGSASTRRRHLDGRPSPRRQPRRVREGGKVLERVRLDAPCFACTLGGEHRRTPLMLTADRRNERELRRQHRPADQRTTHRPPAEVVSVEVV